MNEKLENMADKPKKKRKKIGKYDIIILLIGIGLMVAGIAGIVTSLDAADDYDNSTDIRTVDAVIETIERSEEVIGEKSKGNNKLMVDNINTFLETLHKMKVSYVVDGETYGAGMTSPPTPTARRGINSTSISRPATPSPLRSTGAGTGNTKSWMRKALSTSFSTARPSPWDLSSPQP